MAEEDSGAGRRVCVTGASGFIAGHIVAQLLDKGYEVVGTVRSLANVEAVAYLRNLPGAAERLKLVEADLLAAGSFDSAVTGCEGVFHTASPFFRRQCTPDELIKPAVAGTLNVYGACLKASTIRRVVTTSSFATIIFGHDDSKDPRPYTDQEWNTVSQPTPGDTMNIYRVAKTSAERTGWQFMQEHTPHFDLVTLNPPIVIGPFLPGYARPNESSMIMKEFLAGEKTEIPAGGMGFIDVRDLAKAHILAFEVPGAHGRYLLCTGSLYYSDLCSLLRQEYPQYADNVPSVQAPGTARKPEFDISRTQADLGWQARPFVESLRAQVDSLIATAYLPGQ